ncbi:hypothetical protein BaRGS_00014752 [Batillaria attramentaria]|uniref:Uncharacterized protein n=1 Tax=Batillaria attramentaria TaxID=370345 RepID=A0ABD0L414_9CAEN
MHVSDVVTMAQAEDCVIISNHPPLCPGAQPGVSNHTERATSCGDNEDKALWDLAAGTDQAHGTAKETGTRRGRRNGRTKAAHRAEKINRQIFICCRPSAIGVRYGPSAIRPAQEQ